MSAKSLIANCLLTGTLPSVFLLAAFAPVDAGQSSPVDVYEVDNSLSAQQFPARSSR